MAAQGRGGLSGRLGDLLLLSPNQALDRWSATCTPDPVTVCKEAHTANQGTIGAMETAASSAAGAADGALAGSGNRLVLFAIIAVLTAVALVVTVMVGRGIASRRRLAAGWQAPVPS